jgi:hypothetical protein
MLYTEFLCDKLVLKCCWSSIWPARDAIYTKPLDSKGISEKYIRCNPPHLPFRAPEALYHNFVIIFFRAVNSNYIDFCTRYFTFNKNIYPVTINPVSHTYELNHGHSPFLVVHNFSIISMYWQSGDYTHLKKLTVPHLVKNSLNFIESGNSFSSWQEPASIFCPVM